MQRTLTKSTLISESSRSSATSDSQRPPRRPRSPASMYQAEMVAPKAPKPLIKLEKKGKTSKTLKPASDSQPKRFSKFSLLSSRSTPSLPLKPYAPIEKTVDPSVVEAAALPPVLKCKTSHPSLNSKVSFASSPLTLADTVYSSTTLPNPLAKASLESEAEPDLDIIRRKVDKLERTLGERIPVEFIPPDVWLSPPPRGESTHPVAAESRAKGSVTSVKQKRRASVSLSTFPMLTSVPSLGSLKKVRRPATSHSCNTSVDSHDSGGSLVAPAVPPPPRSGSPQRTLARRAGARVLEEPDIVFAPPVPSLFDSLSRPHIDSASLEDARTPLAERPDAPFSGLTPFLAPHGQIQKGRTDKEGVIDCLSGGIVSWKDQQGWRGEWNQNNMQNVIEKLRALK